MKILFIAPLPPPITGHSLASYVLLKELNKCSEVEVINFNKGSLKQGINSFRRIFQVLLVLYKVYKKKDSTDIIYLTISQSIAGNLKDILTYLICFRNLNKMVIHLHGGGIKNQVFDKYSILFLINKFFLKRVGGCIVLGKSLINIFYNMIDEEKIHTISGFVSNDLSLSEDRIKMKFNKTNPIRILFLSSLIYGKGHWELLKAYKSLDIKLRERVRIDFAGGFDSNDNKKNFLANFNNDSGLFYHGVIDNDQKQELFSKAHFFCLPTYYPYEGQPMAILEAYAFGCVVITTNHAGINDIFVNGINGFQVDKNSYESLAKVIEIIIVETPEKIVNIALMNSMIAKDQYREEVFVGKMVEVFSKIASR